MGKKGANRHANERNSLEISVILNENGGGGTGTSMSEKSQFFRCMENTFRGNFVCSLLIQLVVENIE